LDIFFSYLTLDILSGSEELSGNTGVDIVGFGLFGQGFSEFVGVEGVQ